MASRLLSTLTTTMKYARTVSGTKRSESWNEIVNRNKKMHLIKYRHLLDNNKALRADIDRAYGAVMEKEVLPSMRSMQFAGAAIEKNNLRMYNCCYVPINDVEVFGEILYLLLCGVGVGYSVQYHHINCLPSLNIPQGTENYYIEDSIEGWANAAKHLLYSFTQRNRKLPIFNGELVRPKGSLIRSIERLAPGPDTLLASLNIAKDILMQKATTSCRLDPVNVMDIINVLSQCVVAGGIRRSALICLFTPTDNDMLLAKSIDSKWWVDKPWRARSNNSAVIKRESESEKQDFMRVWNILKSSGSGEPGFYFTNDNNWGTNPCVETALQPYQFCNLTEINASNITSQGDFERRVRSATLIGTLQAGYTDLSYIRPQWKINTEAEALLGVGLTGIGNGALSSINIRRGANYAKEWNEKYASMIGINRAARVTCVKPSGTTSLVLGCASGIHGLHSPYYIRRIRIGKQEALYEVLKERIPDLIEDEIGNSGTGVISIPVKANTTRASYYRNESSMDFLDRIKHINQEWVSNGHVNGINKHNVSATVSVKPEEWDSVAQWMWEYRRHYTGLALLPYDGGLYAQAPFEECDISTYERMRQILDNLSEEHIINAEKQIISSNVEESACAGGLCEL